MQGVFAFCSFQLLHTQQEDYGYFNNVGIGESMNTKVSGKMM